MEVVAVVVVVVLLYEMFVKNVSQGSASTTAATAPVPQTVSSAGGYQFSSVPLQSMDLGGLAVPITVNQSAASNGLDNMGQAIAQYEKANPSLNNPGALETTGGQLATFSDAGDGWGALNSYVTNHATANPTWNFYDFFQNYLGQQQGGPAVTNQGNSDAYAEYVAGYLGVDPTVPVSSVLQGGA